jgi:hypothetical protein
MLFESMPNCGPEKNICRLATETVLLTVCCIVITGCRPSYQLDIAPARGTVTLDGKPLSAGGVLLTPERGRAAGGRLAADGSFVLSTYGHGDGAIIGKHRVAITPPQSENESDKPLPGSVPVPQRYLSATSSSLEVEIKAGQENVFHLPLTTVP